MWLKVKSSLVVTSSVSVVDGLCLGSHAVRKLSTSLLGFFYLRSNLGFGVEILLNIIMIFMQKCI